MSKPGPPRSPSGLERRKRMLAYWLTVGWHHLPGNRSRSLYVLGAPRTGTSWLCYILSHYFGLPLYIAREHHMPVLRPVVMHLHRFAVVPSRTIYTLRDGRDAMVSFYHKSLNTMPDAVLERMAGFCEKPLTHENLHENLPGFIRFVFEGGDFGGSIPYDRHLRRAKELGLYSVRYEDMLANGEETLAAAISFLTNGDVDRARVSETLEATSFERHTGRKRGEEDLSWRSVRKGVAGDWRNGFTPEAARLYDHYAGDLLVECGYEPDRSWVARVKAPPEV